MGEVVPARTSPTLHPPSPPTVHKIVMTSTVRVKLAYNETIHATLCSDFTEDIVVKYNALSCYLALYNFMVTYTIYIYTYSMQQN